MSEFQQYYDGFCQGRWARESTSECPCGGSGWALSEVDTWHKCPCHWAGQPHPEDDLDDLFSREERIAVVVCRYAYPDPHPLVEYGEAMVDDIPF